MNFNIFLFQTFLNILHLNSVGNICPRQCGLGLFDEVFTTGHFGFRFEKSYNFKYEMTVFSLCEPMTF